MAELLAESDRQPEQADHFSLLTGHDGSLRKPIEQMKTALFYPNGGLPLLIVGDSGTGKSYMAELMHEFAIAGDCWRPMRPLSASTAPSTPVTRSCWPPTCLATSKARLPARRAIRPGRLRRQTAACCFSMKSTASMRRAGRSSSLAGSQRSIGVGETAQGMPISLRLVFATTEDIHSTFLTTFIRRIPILISLPDLQNRSRGEKEALTLQFFWQEARTLSARLQLTPRLYRC